MVAHRMLELLAERLLLGLGQSGVGLVLERPGEEIGEVEDAVVEAVRFRSVYQGLPRVVGQAAFVGTPEETDLVEGLAVAGVGADVLLGDRMDIDKGEVDPPHIRIAERLLVVLADHRVDLFPVLPWLIEIEIKIAEQYETWRDQPLFRL